MTNINFIIYFTVEILNKYYADGICNDFIIVPSTNTAALLRGYKMVFKQYNNRFYVGVQTSGVASPPVSFLPIDQNSPFVFFLKCTNPLFYNFTNCPTGGVNGNLLYFSNNNTNAANNKLVLSAVMDDGTGPKYNAADLVMLPASPPLVYEAIKANAGNDLTDTTAWLPVDGDSYVTIKDLMHLQHYVSPPSADLTDISNYLPEADYTELLSSNGICGVINISNSTSPPTGYNVLSLVANSSPPVYSITSPVYSIIFLNKATIWKYILLPGTTGSITQLSPESSPPVFLENSPPTNPILSVLPIRYKERQPATDHYNLQLVTNKPLKFEHIPQATPDKLTPPDKPNYPYNSEIYLNY